MDAPLLIRASLLNPVDPDHWVFYRDGGLLVQDGRLLGVGDMNEFQHHPVSAMLELDSLLVPGFVDVHIHWVQHHVRGRFRGDLMKWLRDRIWPQEEEFDNRLFARRHAQTFFYDTTRAGTTLGMAYSSPHVDALRVAASEAIGDWVLGNAIMQKAAPQSLCEASPDDAAPVARLLKEMGREHYAITPRFALNCSAELMRELGDLARRENALVQTHLSESINEVREIRRAFPEAQDYTDVYDRAGLLGTRSVLGHCIHLSPREHQTLARRGAWIAHCPSSNEALDSGRMDLQAVRRHGIRYALASDVGAGPSHSMLHVMQRYLAQHRDAGVDVSPREALYHATLAGAECLGRGDRAGSFAPGKRADFVELPLPDGRGGPDQWFESLLDGQARDLETRPLRTWIEGSPVDLGLEDDDDWD